MSIRLTLTIVFVVLLASLSSLVYIARLSAANQLVLEQTESRRFESYKLADELRQSSDDLTRMARTYVVTADPAYEKHFHTILAIRSGQHPRPTIYNRVYWDLLIATGKKPCPDGQAVALNELMRDMQFTEEEFGKLREAQARSDALVELENRAMNAVKGRFTDEPGSAAVQRAPDLQLARDLMFGEAYHRAKADIMGPINEFFALLERRTDGEVEAVRRRAGTLADAQLLIAVAAAAFTAVAFLLLNYRVVRPVNQFADRLKDIAEGEGDLRRRVDDRRPDELGTLGRWFNTFVQQVHDIVRAVSESTLEVSSAATEVAASARQQEPIVQSYGASTQQAAVAVQEISATVHELTDTMEELNHAARRTGDKAAAGRQQLGTLDTGMGRLSQGASEIESKIERIRDSVEQISLATSTMVKVADQTNLLSVNAAVEAEKAGDAGQGFRVVAREVRRLAEHSAKATLQIEAIVSGIQQSVSEGVLEMDNFREDVRSGIGQIRAVADEFGEIIGEVAGLTQRFEQIREMMAAQSVGTEQIRESIARINDGAQQISQSLTEFARATDQLREVSGRLRNQVSSFTVDSDG